MWILVIEDDGRLADVLRRGLEAEGYAVDLASDGLEGEEAALLNAYDALIVDWRLPKQDGRTVIENLRKAGRTMPALMLTVLDDVEHRVAGLDAGADDYLAKPFSFEELGARLRALLRRPPLASHDHTLTLGSIVMNTERRTVTKQGAELMLRQKEFALLELLLRHPETVVSRTILAERIWGNALYVTDNVIDVTVSGLRSKIRGTAAEYLEIETVRGVGYRIRSRGPNDS